MPHLSSAGDRLRLTASPMDRVRVKEVPGGRYEVASKTWLFPRAWPQCLALRAVFGAELTMDTDVAEWGFRQLKAHLAVAEAKIATEDIVGFSREGNALHPYPFQNSGARFLGTAGQAMLADEMGTGKTIQTAVALEALDGAQRDPYPALVVCTKSMTHTWKQELERWTTLAPSEIIVVEGPAVKRRRALAENAAVFIMNWESVRLHTRLAPYGSIRLTDAEKTPAELNEIGLSTVVADEAHKMVDYKAKQTRAVWWLMHRAHYRWALTGTPITGKPENLWTIMHGLAPHEYPSRNAFIKRYVLAWSNYWGGLETAGLRPDTRDEFFAFFDNRFFRRTKAEVLPDLPPKVYTSRTVTLAPKQRKAYAAMEKDLLVQLDSGELDLATNPLVLAGKLRYYAAGTPGVDEGRTLGTPSCKVDALADILDEAGGEQVVVFAWHKGLIALCGELLDRRGVTFGKVTGDESAVQRSEAVGAFQNGKLQVMLCSLGAGSEGITLTAASRAVFLQRSWSMVQNRQAEDRLHRAGQEHESVEIIDVIAEDTMEDDVLFASALKEGRLQEVCRDPAFVRRILK